jgi:hypothetical protein
LKQFTIKIKGTYHVYITCIWANKVHKTNLEKIAHLLSILLPPQEIQKDSSVTWPHRWIYGVDQSQTDPVIFIGARPKPINLNYIRRFKVPTNIVSSKFVGTDEYTQINEWTHVFYSVHLCIKFQVQILCIKFQVKIPNNEWAVKKTISDKFVVRNVSNFSLFWYG